MTFLVENKLKTLYVKAEYEEEARQRLKTQRPAKPKKRA